MSDVTASQRLLKQPAEVRKYAMDFSNVLSSSESIISSGVYPQVNSELLDGSSSDLTIYNQVIDGNKIEFWVSGGTDGTSYRIEVSIVTNAEQILEGDGILRVTDR